MTQEPLFDLRTDAEKKRDAALDRVDKNAAIQWKQAAHITALRLMQERTEWTSFDLQTRLKTDYPDQKTHDLRALGPVILAYVKAGRLKPAGFQQHPTRHASPMRVWRVVR